MFFFSFPSLSFLLGLVCFDSSGRAGGLYTPNSKVYETNEYISYRYALAADIQTIPGLPTAPGYLNVDVDAETGEIDGLF